MKLTVAGLVGLTGAAAIAASAPAAGSPAASTAATCTPQTNIEAIIDDSGSMSGTDPTRLRVSAIDLLASTQGNEQRKLGAIEFGSDAQLLFFPIPMGPNKAAIHTVLSNRIQADNGSTDYNVAFNLAKQQNPNADARIFLTDGGHNAGPYLDGHKNGPKTHVIGLGAIFPKGTVDGDRLRTIASDTGGVFRKATDATEIQAAMASVSAAIQCALPPKTFTDLFSSQGQRQAHSVRIGKGIRKVLFTLSWADPANAFDISGFRIVNKGNVVARSGRVRKLKVRKRRGATFVTVKVTKLKKGKLKFRVKAKKLTTPGGAKLITQATRSKRK